MLCGPVDLDDQPRYQLKIYHYPTFCADGNIRVDSRFLFPVFMHNCASFMTPLHQPLGCLPPEAIPDLDHWRPVTRPPALSPGGLHLWKVRTGYEGTPLAQLWPLLSRRESERAVRLRFDHHRACYVRARAGLRMVLSGYLDVAPKAVRFQYGGAGKPFLEDTSSGLEFNLTNSGDLALVVLSVGAPIGVDCERIRDRGDMVATAYRMFTPAQAAQIAAATPEDRLQWFHIVWTALEAGVKTDGRGLLGRHQPATQDVLRIKHCVPEPGFIAAVACERLLPVVDWVTLTLRAD